MPSPKLPFDQEPWLDIGCRISIDDYVLRCRTWHKTCNTAIMQVATKVVFNTLTCFGWHIRLCSTNFMIHDLMMDGKAVQRQHCKYAHVNRLFAFDFYPVVVIPWGDLMWPSHPVKACMQRYVAWATDVCVCMHFLHLAWHVVAAQACVTSGFSKLTSKGWGILGFTSYMAILYEYG